MQVTNTATFERPRTARAYALLALLASCGTPAPSAKPQPEVAAAPAPSAAPAPAAAPALQQAAQSFAPAPLWQDVPGAAFKFELVPIPGDAAKGIAPFWLGRTELTWDAFDAWAYRLDEPADSPAAGAPGAAPDAITRPTKPYLPPDRGFGHENYAVISIAYKNASEFCRWLSQKSGRRFRLPTEAEWEHACRAGTTTKYSFGDDASQLGQYAWFAGNSSGKAQRVGAKKPNAWGLLDMHGNVKEWCVGADGLPVTRGGGWRDAPALLECAAREKQQPAWNASDPNVPKSPWWLSDGSYVGFRVLCEAP
jgi:formylglycine-generating enzyme required for sulfatase activity